ncbi:MAG: TauD/TfdA family dioxygenase [Pseudomonadota bacterium]
MSAQLKPSIENAIPDGPLEGPEAWRGSDLTADTSWMYEFSTAEKQALRDAVDQCQAAGREIIDIGPAEFPLGALAEPLARIRSDVLKGRGFALLRGIPVENYTFEEAAMAYWGIGQHLGVPVSQNAMGHLLGHVTDIGRDENDPTARIYQTNARQYYHSDSCDIVALMCWRKAKSGGLSTIVSSVTLYNEVLARAPELVETLFQPNYFDRRSEVPPGQPPWYYMPIASWYGGNLSTHHVRRYIESARRFDDVPALTDEQVALLDLIDEIVDEPGIHLSMAFEPGDIQLLHNPQILHDRTGFEDFPEPELRRHLLRLWLCAGDGRPLPDYYAQRWGSADPKQRGGVRVEGQKLVAPLEP